MMFNTTNRKNVHQTSQPASLMRCFHCFAWALISIRNPWENFCFVALSPFFPFPSRSLNLSSDSFAHIAGMCSEYRWIFNLVIEYALLCIFFRQFYKLYYLCCTCPIHICTFFLWFRLCVRVCGIVKCLTTAKSRLEIPLVLTLHQYVQTYVGWLIYRHSFTWHLFTQHRISSIFRKNTP